MKRIYSSDYDMGGPTGLNYPGGNETKIVDLDLDGVSRELAHVIFEQYNGIPQVKVTYTPYTQHSDPEIVDVDPIIIADGVDVISEIPDVFQDELYQAAYNQAEEVIAGLYEEAPHGPDDLIG